MALHLSSLSPQSWSQITPSDPPRPSSKRVELGWTSSARSSIHKKEMRVKDGVRVKCAEGVTASLETVGSSVETESLVGKVTEVNLDTFWPIVNSAQDKTVVLDMYTQWCGPCKVMAPKFEKLAQENLDVIFLKLDCNQENKALAKELGIRVVPTFKILKGSKIVKEVTGAKFDELVAAMDAVRSSS